MLYQALTHLRNIVHVYSLHARKSEKRKGRAVDETSLVPRLSLTFSPIRTIYARKNGRRGSTFLHINFARAKKRKGVFKARTRIDVPFSDNQMEIGVNIGGLGL